MEQTNGEKLGKPVLDAPLGKGASIDRINAYVRKRIPFLFFISFDLEHNLVIPLEGSEKRGFFMEMPGMVNHSLRPLSSGKIRIDKRPVEPALYREAFSRVLSHIRYGNTFLLNLTFPTPIQTSHSIRQIFLASRAPFKCCLDDKLVVFSPERFIRIDGRKIRSNPMKGTIDSSVPDAYRKLASDPKEDAEHHTIVDLIRNDLSMVGDRVRVRRFKYIEKVRTNRGELLQMSSEIEASLPEDFQDRLGELIFTLLPAGSICGAPKQKTLHIISEVESYDRGYYTGIFGYFMENRLDCAVAIRYMEQDQGQMVFKSGGGITFRSEWEKEYDEMIRKVYVPVY